MPHQSLVYLYQSEPDDRDLASLLDVLVISHACPRVTMPWSNRGLKFFSISQLEGSSEDASSLRVEDEVEYVVEEDFKADKRYASGLKLLVRGNQKRELGQVRPNFLTCP